MVVFSAACDSAAAPPVVVDQAKLEREFDAKVKAKVIFDAVRQYEIVKRVGDAADRCVHAGIVAAAWLDTGLEDEYRKARAVEKQECAGM